MSKFDLKIVPFRCNGKLFFNFVLPTCNILKTSEEVIEVYQALKDAKLYDGDIPTLQELESIYTGD